MGQLSKLTNQHNVFNYLHRNITAMLVVLTVFSPAAAAEVTQVAAPRFMLWITEPIGATNAIQCNLQISPATFLKLQMNKSTLTEQDVIAWDTRKALWTLDPVRFGRSKSMEELQDHCFVLAIDGKLASSGVVLADYSARLIRFPTISVHHRNEFLDMQLTEGFYGSHSQPILVDEINTVLTKLPSQNRDGKDTKAEKH